MSQVKWLNLNKLVSDGLGAIHSSVALRFSFFHILQSFCNNSSFLFSASFVGSIPKSNSWLTNGRSNAHLENPAPKNNVVTSFSLFSMAVISLANWGECSGQLILATVLESWYLTSDSFGAKPAL